jgi:hypothetical protein
MKGISDLGGVRIAAVLVGLFVSPIVAWPQSADGTKPVPPASGDRPQPVLVELFTSEGCSSCPPADEFLSDLVKVGAAAGAPVVALSEHVDYWNRLGWTDPFSAKSFTTRQQEYSERLSSDVFTPQLVIDGRWQCVGSDRTAALAAIREAAGSPKAHVTAQISREGDVLAITSAIEPGGLASLPDADVLLAITEGGLVSNVEGGENRGRHLKHAAVVRTFKSIGRVKGGAGSTQLTARVPVAADWRVENTSVVIVLQSRKDRAVTGLWSGPIQPNGQARVEGR